MPRTSESTNQMDACASHCGGASSGLSSPRPAPTYGPGAHHGGEAYLVSSRLSGSNCISGICLNLGQGLARSRTWMRYRNSRSASIPFYGSSKRRSGRLRAPEPRSKGNRSATGPRLSKLDTPRLTNPSVPNRSGLTVFRDCRGSGVQCLSDAFQLGAELGQQAFDCIQPRTKLSDLLPFHSASSIARS